MSDFLHFSRLYKKSFRSVSLFSVFILLFVMLPGLVSAAATDEKFTVRYNGNGADSGHISDQAAKGTEVVLKKNESLPGTSDRPFTRNGCSFLGWSIKEDIDEGPVTIIPGGEIWNVDDEAIVHYYDESINGYTLYAWWKCSEGIAGRHRNVSFTVTYNGNGAESGRLASQTAEAGEYVTVKNNENGSGDTALTRKGYVFSGWNTKADGTGTNFRAGAMFRIGQNYTLYAQWLKLIEPTATPVPPSTKMAEPTKTPKPGPAKTQAPALTKTPEPTNTPVTTATKTLRPTATLRPTQTIRPTRTPKPTRTLQPTRTPRPTATPRPTRTPRPTATPRPTRTPRR